MCIYIYNRYVSQVGMAFIKEYCTRPHRATAG